jgi:AraC family transcriptional regulator
MCCYRRIAQSLSKPKVFGEVRKELTMEAHLEDTLTVSKLDSQRSREWMHRMMRLLEAAVDQLRDVQHPAQGTLLEAASLLSEQILPRPADDASNRDRGLLAWQARKVNDYIDSHITEPVLITDLCALIQYSRAHFARSFKRTFGQSPHSFVVRRRLELAARYMLATDAPLSDIALRCGFADQAHLCNRFRQATGQTPAAWRRVYRLQRNANSKPAGHFGWLRSLDDFASAHEPLAAF